VYTFLNTGLVRIEQEHSEIYKCKNNDNLIHINDVINVEHMKKCKNKSVFHVDKPYT